jgi:integrase
LEELRREYRLSGRSSSTPRLYAGYVKNWVKPALGELQAREVLAGPCNNLVQRGRDQSYDTAKSIRAVLSGICAYAVRNGAMQVNPAKSTARLTRGETREVKALILEQRVDLIARLEQLAIDRQTDKLGRSKGKRARVWLDLPDLVRGMLATGVRLGELLAMDSDEVIPASEQVLIGHHLVREPGQGLVRLSNRKGNGEGLLLGVPEWSLPMWRRRKLASGGGPLFPSWNGRWSDPSNVINRIREAMDACGYDWVTSHVWRKTVATVLDEADLPTTAIADQLGNTVKIVEQHYRRKREANAASREALEGMFGDAENG